MSADATSPVPPAADRRPLKSRQSPWAKSAAFWLARRGVTPNAISVFSIVFAAVACAAFVMTRYVTHSWEFAMLLIVAVIGMQARLLANLLDGMVAVEAGAGPTKVGEIYNDLPDRIADIVIFIGAGVCAGGDWGITLGLACAVGCLFTAYVRVLGKSMGTRAHFIGPMAKQHRMAMLSGTCLVGVGLILFTPYFHRVLAIALGVIVVGCAITVMRRLRAIIRDLEAA